MNIQIYTEVISTYCDHDSIDPGPESSKSRALS